jgi:hypothetical protein
MALSDSYFDPGGVATASVDDIWNNGSDLTALWYTPQASGIVTMSQAMVIVHGDVLCSRLAMLSSP